MKANPLLKHLSILLLIAGIGPLAAFSKPDSTFSKAWPDIERGPEIREFSCKFGREKPNYGRNFKNWSDYCLENNLEKETTAIYEVKCQQSQNGTVSLSYHLCSPKLSQEDKFYCEQAFWEAVLMKEDSGPFDTQLNLPAFTPRDNFSHCRELYFKHHPDKKNKCVVIHVIPPSLERRFPRPAAADEIHSELNLRAVKMSMVNSLLLKDFRKDWIDFADAFTTSNQPSRAKVLAKADELTSKYHDLFVE